MTDIAKIAKGLSDWAELALRCGVSICGAAKELRDKGLWQTVDVGIYETTPKGLAVRDYLKENGYG